MKDKYNDGYTHEALHSAHIVTCMFDDFVSRTRCADEFQDVKLACEKAAGALCEVYLLIGMKFRDQ